MNASALMRIKIDYLDNKIDLGVAAYKDVIRDLILEVERLNAENVATRAILDGVRK